MTYTYVLMDVSESTYQEVKKKLEEAAYFQALHEDPMDGILLDMHGIALRLEKHEDKNPKRNSKASKSNL